MNYLLPVYEPHVFVGREAPIQKIEKVIAAVKQKNAKCRTVIIRAERGVGKSWLALHLNRCIFPEQGVRSFLIRLTPLDRRESLEPKPNEWFAGSVIQTDPPEKTCEQILKWLLKQLDFPPVQNASLEDRTIWLTRHIQGQPEQTWALLVDSAFESDWGLLKMLEHRLLAPLAALPNVLIVITGRGRVYPWESPYLRVENLEIQLEKLETQSDEPLAQIQKLGKYEKKMKLLPEEQWKGVVELTRGHPLATAVLIQQGTQLDDVIEELLSVVAPEQHETIRQYLEALCPLDGFREGEIGPMLAAYFGDVVYETWTDRQIREQVRDVLLQTNLLEWRGGKFHIENNLADFLIEYIKKNKLTIWQGLNQKAAELYGQWAVQYPRAQEYYQRLAESHQRSVIA